MLPRAAMASPATAVYSWAHLPRAWPSECKFSASAVSAALQRCCAGLCCSTLRVYLQGGGVSEGTPPAVQLLSGGVDALRHTGEQGRPADRISAVAAGYRYRNNSYNCGSRGGCLAGAQPPASSTHPPLGAPTAACPRPRPAQSGSQCVYAHVGLLDARVDVSRPAPPLPAERF